MDIIRPFPGRNEPARLGPVRFGLKIIRYFTWRHNQYGGTAKNILLVMGQQQSRDPGRLQQQPLTLGLTLTLTITLTRLHSLRIKIF